MKDKISDGCPRVLVENVAQGADFNRKESELMKTTRISLVIATVISGAVWADRPLEKPEISQILQTLTSRTMKTWISSGTISATHEEYRAPKTTDTGEISDRINQAIAEHQNEAINTDLSADIRKMKLDAIPFNVRYELSNEYTMKANETVKYDGSRFSWEINVDSRTDSVRPGAELAGNDMTNEFDLADNGQRAFVWNGYQYTLYSRSRNSAFVDAGNKLPRAVNGPLTAGLIPWGYGPYTYGNLASLESSAVEKQLNGQTQIHLTLDKPDGSRMLFVLDADKNYAVISHATEGWYRTVSRQYGSYQSVAGGLVPTTITIEEYDAATNRLLARDSWYITSVSSGAPLIGDFTLSYQEGAQVEYDSPVLGETSIYRHSSRLDTELLLAERLSFATSQDGRTKNCATAALGYAALRLGRKIPDSQLAQLVDGRTGQTSLLAMKEFVHRQGLYCRAVRTDTETLKTLTDCQVILHIPHKNHFVLLGDIDSESIWTIDIAGRKFCYRADVSFLGMDWTDGTALLISDAPITGAFDDIDDSGLVNITGRAGYTCTSLLQESAVSFCYWSGYYCPNSSYQYYPERWGCEEAESGMCWDDRKLALAECQCRPNEYETDCETYGAWSFNFMTACY